MNSTVTEIAADVFRISTYHPAYEIQFNQFLIRDDEPFLMHTGFRKWFPLTLHAVASVMPPEKLRWIGYSHFEPDECGALNEWLQVARHAEPVCSLVGKLVMLDDFADRPARALHDNEVLEIGRRRLQFLATPHLPHGWDAGLFYELTDATLLCSDLFFQAGDPPPLDEGDIVEPAAAAMRASLEGPLCKDMPYTSDTEPILQRLADLNPRTLATMHGSSYRGDGAAAIRELARVVSKMYGPDIGT
jgi:flavorubredoxin